MYVCMYVCVIKHAISSLNFIDINNHVFITLQGPAKIHVLVDWHIGYQVTVSLVHGGKTLAGAGHVTLKMWLREGVWAKYQIHMLASLHFSHA